MVGILLASVWLLGCLGAMVLAADSAVGAALLACGAASLLGAVAARRRVRLCVAAATLACLALGAARVTLWLPAFEHDPLAQFRGAALIRGVVVGEPREIGNATSFQVEADSAFVDGVWAPTGGGIQVVALPGLGIEAGALVELRGRLEAARNRPGYPQANMLKRMGAHDVMEFPAVRLRGTTGGGVSTWLPRLRAWLEGNVALRLGEPNASLVKGLLLGGSSRLNTALRDDLQATGTSHLVAVSGYNVSLVAGLLQVLLVGTIGRRRAWPLIAVGIVLFTILVGAPPSAVRAALMAILVVIAAAVGRLNDSLTALTLGAALMVGADPSLLGDLGFQLSFLATLGLVVVAPRLAARLSRLPAWLAGVLSATVAAQLATLPLAVLYFRTLPLVALPANLVVAPIVGLVMACGLPLALFGWSDLLAEIAVLPAWLASELMLLVIGGFASAPGPRLWFGAVPGGLVAAIYVVAALWILATSPSVRAHVPRLPDAAASPRMYVAGLGSCIALTAALTWPSGGDGLLHVVFFETSGSAVFVRGPTGETALIGAGSSPAGLGTEVSDQLSFWERWLDVVVQTDEDQSESLNTLGQRYPAQLLLAPSAGAASRLAQPSHVVTEGVAVQLEAGVLLSVDRATADGLDVRLSHGRVMVLMPSRVGASRMETEGTRTVLRLPADDAGSWKATDLVRDLRPELVVSAGSSVPPGLVRTPAYAAGKGAIELITDGEAIWLAVPRCPDANAPPGCLELTAAQDDR